MADNREPMHGSYNERLNNENQAKQRDGRIITVRRALAGAGLALAGVLAATSVAGIFNRQDPEQTGTNYPSATATETFDPREELSEILKTDAEAKVHIDGKVSINLDMYPRGPIPRIRTSPELIDYENSNALLGISDFKEINGIPVDFGKPEVSFTLKDYITVKGDNPDDRRTEADRGTWVVINLTTANGENILGYISKSNATAGSVQAIEIGNPTSLDLFTGSDQLKDLNKTTVTSNP